MDYNLALRLSEKPYKKRQLFHNKCFRVEFEWNSCDIMRPQKRRTHTFHTTEYPEGETAMKTEKESNVLKEKAERTDRKLRVLSEEDLAQVSGGAYYYGCLGLYKDIRCSTPNCYLNLDVQPTAFDPIPGALCPVCHKGTISFTFIPYSD